MNERKTTLKEILEIIEKFENELNIMVKERNLTMGGEHIMQYIYTPRR